MPNGQVTVPCIKITEGKKPCGMPITVMIDHHERILSYSESCYHVLDAFDVKQAYRVHKGATSPPPSQQGSTFTNGRSVMPAGTKSKKTEKNPKAATPATPATPTEAPATPAQPARAKAEKKNGVAMPQAGVTARVWAIANQISGDLGSPAPRKDVMEAAKAEGINEATIATQYGRWRKFHGLGRANPAPKPADEPEVEGEEPEEDEVEEDED